MKDIYQFTAKTITGETIAMEQYRGKTMLIVNTASQCGFTKHYEGLQQLHNKYSSKGLVVLGFPCNQFGNQEPGGEKEISDFCKRNYGVEFQLFSKIDVNGSDAHPLFTFLAESQPGLLGIKFIKWNFTKFLVNKQGVPVKRHSPSTPPEKIESDILALL